MKSLLNELHQVNTAIAETEATLTALRNERYRINSQISEYLHTSAEMEAIKQNLKKTREALTL
jgi:septal ring factor EnvC (AmiA/AmiB activator)